MKPTDISTVVGAIAGSYLFSELLIGVINYKYPDIFHETNEWYLKQLPFNSLYLQPNSADTHPQQSHLLHTHSPKPSLKRSTGSTKNEL